MSALMDQLLYDGDDSGDEGELNAMPMGSFSARLPSTSAFSLAAPSPGALESLAGVMASASSAMSPPSVSAPVTSMALASTPTTPPRPMAAGAGPARLPDTGDELYPQTLAMLERMLPPEQYAAIYSNAHNGNSNDAKTIADVIRRATGDAIVASATQRFNLTRNQLASVQSGTQVPLSSAAAGARSTLLALEITTSSLSLAPPQPPIVAPSPRGVPVAAFKTSVAVERPTLIAVKPPSATVKSRPSPSFPPSPLVVPTAAAAPAATGDVSPAISEQDKIQFATHLVLHVSSCTLPPGNCRFKRCGDLRQKIRHNVSCNTQSCLNCIQLRAFVKYHAEACLVLVGEHCKVPFCDDIRSKKVTAMRAATPATAASALAATNTLSSAMSDKDEDNVPLASATKKSITTRLSKLLPMLSPRNSSTMASKDASTVKLTEASARAPNVSGTTSPAAVSAATTANLQAQEFGSLLQIILHVQKCTNSTCAVGKICVETRKLLRQANAPDAPVRAQTLERVYRHYKICLGKNNTQNCPICKIGLTPIITMKGYSTTARAASSIQFATTTTTASVAASSAGSTLTVATVSSISSTLKRTNSSMPSPRSPKRLRITTKVDGKAFSGTATLLGGSAAAAADQHSSDLSSTNRNDLRKEEDVLTHTGIDLNTERRAMMMDRFGSKPKKIPEQLHSTKHAWLQNDLFQNDKLTRHMERIARQQGVSLGGSSAATTKIMAHALQEYLKQVMEEMVEAATLRGDVTGQAVDALVKKDLGSSTAPRELTSTDILRVSCDDSFARLRHDDMALRANLLEEAKREELAEKERSKKRKKVDRVKLQAQEEKDEAEMDIEELAIKDLKERLLQEDKDGVVRVDGRVNESPTSKFQRRVDHQVTIEDASYWLENQKPYVNTKLFVRAEAARIATIT